METPDSQAKKNRTVKINKKQTEWYLALAALLVLSIAWWTGKKRWEKRQTRQIYSVYPDSLFKLTPRGEGFWQLQPANQRDTAYIALGSAKGYGGPVRIAASFSNNLKINKIHVISSAETPSYFYRVKKENYLDHFTQLSYDHNMMKIAGVNAVSGATQTCRAIAGATRDASLTMSRHIEKAHLVPAEKHNIQFGTRETILVLLFTLSMLARVPAFKYKKALRWTTLSAGLLFLGFIYNHPLNLTQMNAMLAGFWPDWHEQIYVYLLVFGLIAIMLTSGKNLYCSHFCPFGAFQEILGKLGKAKPARLRARYMWLWLQRSLAWVAIAAALITRNPGVSGYEIFGAAFRFQGSSRLLILFSLMVVTSLMIHRPWCNFLCPVKPITDFIALFRKKLVQPWIKKIKPAGEKNI